MPWVGLEPRNPEFKREKAVHALERATTVLCIVVTQCAERGFHTSVADSSNFTCRWHPPTIVSLSSAVVVLTKDACLKEILEACNLYFCLVLEVVICLRVCDNLVHSSPGIAIHKHIPDVILPQNCGNLHGHVDARCSLSEDPLVWKDCWAPMIRLCFSPN
jgi:hypothetical protein